jgi:tetratricopeptide (TPR) repeat protein
MHGEFDRAFTAAAHGIELGRQIEHLPTQAACVFFCGVVRGWHGDLDLAGPEFEEALALCDKSGDVFRKYLAYGWRGQARLLAGEPWAARADLDLCLQLGDQIGTTFHRGAFQAFRAKLHLLDDELGDALRDSAEALEVATESAQAWSHSIALGVHAEALAALQPPKLGQAAQELDIAVRIQERRECVFDLMWTRLTLGRVLAAQGDIDGATEALRLAAHGFGAMDVTPGLEKARAELEGLGQPSAAPPATPG